MSNLTRIPIVDKDKCKPRKCGQECKQKCPVVQMGKLCIVVTPTSKTTEISESLCTGCGFCAKVCPFNAIKMVNIPTNLEKEVIHRYTLNGFKLHRLPIPRRGQVLGLTSSNGLGKSTALKILAGKLTPNFGNVGQNATHQEIITHYRGSELQHYFTRIIQEDLKALIKPQFVDQIPQYYKGTVSNALTSKDTKNIKDKIIKDLELENVLENKAGILSGGELQRFAIALTCVQTADIYMFDEPSSYLDIKQRINMAQVIRNLLNDQNYVIAVEHDLSILDYLSDYICILYGEPGGYGVVTMPYSVREGLNIFLEGYIPTENMRFREIPLTFKITDNTDREFSKNTSIYKYSDMICTQGNFKLTVNGSSFGESEIILGLGQNGSGKTTFLKLLTGIILPDNDAAVPQMTVSYKPQKISPTLTGNVRSLLFNKLGTSWQHHLFTCEVIKPLQIERLLDQDIKSLSGGELQRVALTLCLGKPAQVYLIDEPSAYLDAEQRIIVARMLKRFILNNKKTAIIIEHDFIMATYLADKVMVYSGTPSVSCTVSAPQSLLTGMNEFLKQLNTTYRRDPENFRPRINKLNSVMDREQKEKGEYFYCDI
jgi:ATP-binding cassette subfamily E protein 1